MNQSFIIRKPFGNATTGKLGMWLFIVMDGITFATVLLGGIYLRLRSDIWPSAGEILNIPLTSFNTFLLILTSFTMVMALNAVKENNLRGLKLFLLLTILGGVLFLGIQVYEYNHFINGNLKLGLLLKKWGFMRESSFLWTTGTYGATFYTTTLFHGFHVLSGVIYLSIILYQTTKGFYSVDQVEVAGLFWHFVDLVWILVFTIIYLI